MADNEAESKTGLKEGKKSQKETDDMEVMREGKGVGRAWGFGVKEAVDAFKRPT